MFSIGATPKQLAIMTKAFDDYCQAHRIADEADRESIAFAVITLFDLWQHPFEMEGKTIPWEAAMALMTDRSGRPGPSTWEGGDYPADQGRHPVAGISWYEADAYARFVGKSLPTVLHWNRAATVRNSAPPTAHWPGCPP